MQSFWRKILDLTYPITSMFTGEKQIFILDRKKLEYLGASFNETIEEALLDVQIEDLWIPYFCITTDISASKMRVHTSGKFSNYSSNVFLQGKKDVCCGKKDSEHRRTFLQVVCGVMSVHQ